MTKTDAFDGAKLALFLGPAIVVIMRDDLPSIAWPGFLDLPGGGREHDEDPVACVLRETEEEIGVALKPKDLVWSRCFQHGAARQWFFVAHQHAELVHNLVLGNEGQFWTLMAPETYISHPKAIPRLAARLEVYLGARRA